MHDLLNKLDLNMGQEKNMRKKIIAILLMISVLAMPCAAAYEKEGTEEQLLKIEKYIHTNFSKLKTPGLSVGVTIDGQSKYFNMGTISARSTEEITSNTNYEICSLSKSFTGTAIRLLEYEGKLSSKDNVSKYIDGFHGVYDDVKYEITIEQLLAHKSGISNSDLKLIKDDLFGKDLMNTVKGLSGIRLQNNPGEIFEYSSVNYDVLGAIIETITNKSYKEYMELEIFKPLEMVNTYVGHNQLDSDYAEGHKITFFEPVEYNSPVFTANAPAGYIESNVNDMMLWVNAQISKSDTALSHAIQNTHVPDTTTQPSGKYLYSNGWFKEISDEEVFNHGGNNPGYATFISMNLTRKVAIVVLANSNSVNVDQFASNIEDYLYGGTLKDVEQSAGGMDTIFSVIMIIALLLIMGEIIFAIKLLHGVCCKKYTWKFTTNSLKKVIPYAVFALLFTYGMYLIPQIIENTNWYMATIWMSSTLPQALWLLGAGIIFGDAMFFIYLNVKKS